MSRIVWGALPERYYEYGVDRGVLYVGSLTGVPWNGLISVAESVEGGNVRPAYIDGYKFRNVIAREEFVATIEAFAAPKEFGPCDGSLEIHNGLIATNQPRVPFDLTYRTRIGNAAEGPESAYKIHLVYNALASPSEQTHSSSGESNDPSSKSWSVTTRPPYTNEFRPTAHFIIDTRHVASPAVLEEFEDLLYGTDAVAARMPTQTELIGIFAP